jgi:hypothetical protein
MVPLTHFDKIDYRKPKAYRFDVPLLNIVGFDSEAYRTGKTFLFCTSLGDAIRPGDLIDTIFGDKYVSSNFVCWNLKYESGAILRCFPRPVIRELQRVHKVIFTYNNKKYDIRYIPHKRLKIKEVKFGGKSVRFWDIAPFYGRISLDTASKKYLELSKLDSDTELYTEEYVADHLDEIIRYCVQDAVLTHKLADLWMEKFHKTGIPVISLYSEASISFTYISRKAEIVTPWEFWEHNRKLIRMAFESYEGGKFEITARGKFSGYEYDISSAYPYEIANLIDIRGAKVEYSRKYVHDAVYGFLRVRIRVVDPYAHLPCGLFRKLRIYPMGDYYLTITKQEYDYIVTLPGCYIVILDGAWIIVSQYRYPYKSVMSEIYEKKTYWKKRDILTSNNYKIIANGFYGKMAQCIPSPDGTYIAGAGWNPMYASIITANTRIAVTRLQNLLGSSCLAVHTDSVICTEPIPDGFIGKELGKFELVERGDGILVSCGIYEINGQSALKGFGKKPLCQSCKKCKIQSGCLHEYGSVECRKRHVKNGYLLKDSTIRDVLMENPGKMKIDLRSLHVESWLQSMAQNHDTDFINLFSDIPKILTLNCDSKRLWHNPVTSDDLLNSLQVSAPLVEHQKTVPIYWKEKY